MNWRNNTSGQCERDFQRVRVLVSWQCRVQTMFFWYEPALCGYSKRAKNLFIFKADLCLSLYHSVGKSFCLSLPPISLSLALCLCLSVSLSLSLSLSQSHSLTLTLPPSLPPSTLSLSLSTSLSLSLSLLIVLIIFVCGIVVFICVCSIARTGC